MHFLLKIIIIISETLNKEKRRAGKEAERERMTVTTTLLVTVTLVPEDADTHQFSFADLKFVQRLKA